MRKLDSVAASIVRTTQDQDADSRTLLDRWKFILALAQDATLGRGALAAAIVILESRDKRTDVYACTYGQIKDRTGIDRSTAIRAVNALVARGWFLRLSPNGRALPNHSGVDATTMVAWALLPWWRGRTTLVAWMPPLPSTPYLPAVYPL